jgi:hypothetical protein
MPQRTDSKRYDVGRSFRDGAPDPEGSRARVTEVQIALLRVQARSLRTQQRAWAASTTRRLPFPPASRLY